MSRSNYMSILSALFLFVLYVAVAVAIFLITRAIWLWYFRINEIVDALKDSVSTLERIEKAFTATRQPVDSAPPKSTPSSSASRPRFSESIEADIAILKSGKK